MVRGYSIGEPMTTLTPERIEEIRKRLEAATPGPWSTDAWEKFIRYAIEKDAETNVDAAVLLMTERGTKSQTRKDADFIAHAPQDISDLLSAYDALSRDVGTSGMETVVKMPRSPGLSPRPGSASAGFAPLAGSEGQTENELVSIGCKAADVHLTCSWPRCQCTQIPKAIQAVLNAQDRRALSRDGMREALVKAAEAYTAARECAPVGDWQGRLDERGWELAEAVRAYHKSPSPDAPRQKVEG